MHLPKCHFSLSSERGNYTLRAIGNAMRPDLALLEDRVALRQGKKQIYGSQIGMDPETGEYFVSPLEDPDNVVERRIKMG